MLTVDKSAIIRAKKGIGLFGTFEPAYLTLLRTTRGNIITLNKHHPTKFCDKEGKGGNKPPKNHT